MSATDELRALLDERGVKWWPKHDIENGYCEDRDTEFLVYGCKHVAHEWCYRLNVDMLTPTQAIEATLGRGECRNTQDDFDFMCSECGKCVDNGRVLGFNYCPNCGRQVKR